MPSTHIAVPVLAASEPIMLDPAARTLGALAACKAGACGAECRGSRAGTVEAVGDGRVGERTQEFQLKAGDTIVYSKFGIGATDLEVQGETYVLIKEDDCIGTMPRPGATAADVPELKPIGDRVLLKVGIPGFIRGCRACFSQVTGKATILWPGATTTGALSWFLLAAPYRRKPRRGKLAAWWYVLPLRVVNGSTAIGLGALHRCRSRRA